MSGLVLGDERPTARKEHRCDLCSRTIAPGEEYRRSRIIGDDGPYVFKECPHCLACIAHTSVAENAHYYGEGYGSEDFIEWVPVTVWEARLRAQWRRQWRRRDGSLYSTPTPNEATA